MNPHTKKLTLDFSSSFSAEAFGLGLMFVQMLLINRWYGVEIYGQFILIVSATGLVGSILTARTSEAVTRFYKREKLNPLGKANSVLALGFLIDLITAVCLVSIIFLLSDFLSLTFLKSEVIGSLIALYSISVFFLYLRGTIFGYYQAVEKFAVVNIFKILNNFIPVILLCLFFYGDVYSPLQSIIYSVVLGTAITFFMLMVTFIFNVLMLENSKSGKISIDSDLAQEYLVFNAKTFVSSALKFGSTNIDNLIFGYYITAEVVGLYQTIKKFLTPLAVVSNSLAFIMLAKIVGWYEKGEKVLMTRKIAELSLYAVSGSFMMAMALYFLLEPYTIFQGIVLTSEIQTSFSIIAFYFLLGGATWWGRSFIIVHNPMVPIYTNLLLTINSIWVPIALVYLDVLDPLVMVSMSLIIAYLPSWLVTPVIFRNYIRSKVVLDELENQN